MDVYRIPNGIAVGDQSIATKYRQSVFEIVSG